MLCYHMNMIKHSIRYFNNKQIRAVWDNEKSIWWYAAVDFIAVLVDPKSPRRYWNNIKVRNPELSSFCGQLKLYADDGKKYLSDVINEEGVRLLIGDLFVSFLTITSKKIRDAFIASFLLFSML